MKKIFLLVGLVLGVISCSDEDYPLVSPEPEVQKPPLVSKITVLKNSKPEEVYHFTYDAKHRMQKLSYDEGATSIQYTYNNADLVTTMVFNDNANATLDFHYNTENIPTAYEHNNDGILLPVTYDATTNHYTFGPNDFLLNAIGDIKSTTRVHYDFNVNKGMFANVVGPNIMMMNALVGQFVSTGSKVAMSKIYNDTAQMYDIETTYNDSGYPVQIDYIGLLPLHPNRTFILEY